MKEEKRISFYLKLTAKEIFGGDPDSPTRKRGSVDARIAISAYIFNKQKRREDEKKFNLTEVGLAFDSKRDHSTIIHYLKSHNNLVQTDRNYRLKYIKFASILKEFERKQNLKEQQKLENQNCNEAVFLIRKVKSNI